MKLFLLGEFNSETGTSLANNQIKLGFLQSEYGDKVYYSKANNLFSRILEVIYKTYLSDNVCICSMSLINYFAIFISKILNKKVYYLMHGYKTFEMTFQRDLNHRIVQRYTNLERFIFDNSEKIICVSKRFMEFMKYNDPKHREKFIFNYNGLNLEEIFEI